MAAACGQVSSSNRGNGGGDNGAVFGHVALRMDQGRETTVSLCWPGRADPFSMCSIRFNTSC